MACVGHHAYPFTPAYTNMDLFHGKITHSHGYKTFSGMEEKSVLIIGAGNSGGDIAVDISCVAKKVILKSHTLILSVFFIILIITSICFL